MFMLYRLKQSWNKITLGIGNGGSPVFLASFILVGIAASLSVIRGIVSMTFDIATFSGIDANKILWVILRFFLLMAELSVLIFAVAFGHMDSKRSIQWVIIVTACFSLVYSIIQCTLELLNYDPHFHTYLEKRKVYGHGGTKFCLTTSVLLLIIYSGVIALPFVKWLQKYLSVPTRKSFYFYAAIMILLNLISTVGCILLLFDNNFGLCMLDAFSLVYFTTFAPLLYWTFLRLHFGKSQRNGVMYSYSTHVDEELPDVAGFDMPNNNETIVDSTLSGILVFNDERNEILPHFLQHVEEPLNNISSHTIDVATSVIFESPINVNPLV
ncbi:transmembrane protein adipocyte-associated 1-like isoform X2 [Clavelina lepadiformis]